MTSSPAAQIVPSSQKCCLYEAFAMETLEADPEGGATNDRSTRTATTTNNNNNNIVNVLDCTAININSNTTVRVDITTNPTHTRSM